MATVQGRIPRPHPLPRPGALGALAATALAAAALAAAGPPPPAGAATRPAGGPPVPATLVVDVESRDGAAGDLGAVVTCTAGPATTGTVTTSSAVAQARAVEIDASGQGRIRVPATVGDDCVVAPETGAGWVLADVGGGDAVRDDDGDLRGVRIRVGEGTTTVRLGVVAPVATGTGALIVERTSRDGDYARLGVGAGVVLLGLGLTAGVVHRRRQAAANPRWLQDIDAGPRLPYRV